MTRVTRTAARLLMAFATTYVAWGSLGGDGLAV